MIGKRLLRTTERSGKRFRGRKFNSPSLLAFACTFFCILGDVYASTDSTQSNAVHVSKGTELQKALNNRRIETIILADGTYDSPSYFKSVCGHRLEAENIGKAVLLAGLSVGGKSCRGKTAVRGLRFDVSDPKKAVNGHVINVWGQATSTSLTDLEIEGNNIMQSGVAVRQPEGAELRRIVAKGFKSFGIVIQSDKRVRFAEKHDFGRPVVLEDITISEVSRTVPKSSSGTAEACIWAGEPISATGLSLDRCAWMGLWTGSATEGSTFSNVVVRNSETGLYLGHYTRNSKFRDIHIGPGVKFGIKCEWAAPQWDRIAACHGVLIEDADIRSSCAGVVLDAGTQDTTVRRSTFRDQKAFAIGNFRGSGNLWDTSSNDFSGIQQGAAKIYTSGPMQAIYNCKDN